AVLTPDQEAAVQGKVLHLPMTCGAIVLSYNLPDVKDTLRFTPEIIAGIFLGKITRWNDTALVRANSGVSLPARDIIVVHRSDGSGTTSIFTTYLCKVSPRWQQVVGGGSAVSWPVGIGGKGNDGVAGSIQQTVGAIGYIELAYAEKNHIAFGKVRNKAGRFITPTVNSVSAAANIAIPPDGKAIISNTDAPDGYPLSGLSWVLVRQEQRYNGRTQARARQLSALLRWMVTDGQQYSGPLYYAPLPEAAAKTSLQLINTITYNNQPLLP
ncbi:MAG: phosphate ABC transporter substrate-binding protein PstS, partial [Chitinophagia bacterium]|nr:phosphate ABC transporter substrate-binding protein PstS [Chitinophagia bacterium]